MPESVFDRLIPKKLDRGDDPETRHFSQNLGPQSVDRPCRRHRSSEGCWPKSLSPSTNRTSPSSSSLMPRRKCASKSANALRHRLSPLKSRLYVSEIWFGALMSWRFKHHLWTRVAASVFQTLHALTPEAVDRLEPRVATAADLPVAMADQFAKYRAKRNSRKSLRLDWKIVARMQMACCSIYPLLETMAQPPDWPIVACQAGVPRSPCVGFPRLVAKSRYRSSDLLATWFSCSALTNDR